MLSDEHIQFQDKKINDLLIDKFIPEFKPDYIDLLGDLVDFYQISKFRKDPSRKGNLQQDIDSAKDYLRRLREGSPEAQITLHYGNHLCRLKKYIWDKANELDCLNAIDLKILLDVEKYKIKVIDAEEGFEIRDKLVLTHGTIISQESAMTARRNLVRYGQSVIHSHTHRLGSTYKTDLRGTIGAWENGCLCSLDLIHEWGRELANWQVGFSTIHFSTNGFNVQQVPIIKGRFIYGENEYNI